MPFYGLFTGQSDVNELNWSPRPRRPGWFSVQEELIATCTCTYPESFVLGDIVRRVQISILVLDSR